MLWTMVRSGHFINITVFALQIVFFFWISFGLPSGGIQQLQLQSKQNKKDYALRNSDLKCNFSSEILTKKTITFSFFFFFDYYNDLTSNNARIAIVL